MNPLGNGNLNQSANSGLSPQMQQNIQQVKGMMNMFRSNPTAIMQQNPMMSQIMQMCQGQNPEQVFYAMCKQKGIDPNLILNEFRR